MLVKQPPLHHSSTARQSGIQFLGETHISSKKYFRQALMTGAPKGLHQPVMNKQR